jgi:hypothetical protein
MLEAHPAIVAALAVDLGRATGQPDGPPRADRGHPERRPVRLWQSRQWQIETASGSISASKLIRPQWHCPSTFMASPQDKNGARRRRFIIFPSLRSQ